MDTTLEAVSGIVGLLLPLLIAAIQRTAWSETVRAIVALVVCVVAAVPVAYFSGQLDFTNWGMSAGIILVAAWASFGKFWNKTGLTKKIEGLTNK